MPKDFERKTPPQSIDAEMAVLGDIQKDDGGFDISWQWYTAYPEFENARNFWRPRVTLEKSLFARTAEKYI